MDANLSIGEIIIDTELGIFNQKHLFQPFRSTSFFSFDSNLTAPRSHR